MFTIVLIISYFSLAVMETAGYTPCYHNTTQVDYRGTVSYTETGKTCQKWSSQSPHQHKYTSINYPNDGLGDHNYCRNPGNEHHIAWCYTTDPITRYENCKVPSIEEACEFTECYHNKTQIDYRGIMSRTISGLVCQKWTSQSPHLHKYTPDIYAADGIGDHNQCRNPGNEHNSTWCFTINPDVQWEECKISVPEQGCSYTECSHDEDLHDYRGTVYLTVTGKTCQRWDSQSPQEHKYTPEAYAADGVGNHNYCRNPGKDHHRTWCYTTTTYQRWDNCEVSAPGLGCEFTECYHDLRQIDYRGTISETESGRTCQRWDSQNPHVHSYAPDKFSAHGIGEHNYCRNPGYDHHRAWCYTSNPHVTWENCKIPLPEEGCDIGVDTGDGGGKVCNKTQYMPSVEGSPDATYDIGTSTEQSGHDYITTPLIVVSLLLNVVSLAAVLYLVYAIVRRQRQSGLLSEPSYSELVGQQNSGL
ncbi:plasminogen-like [Glandiceps talaboti]